MISKELSKIQVVLNKTTIKKLEELAELEYTSVSGYCRKLIENTINPKK